MSDFNIIHISLLIPDFTNTNPTSQTRAPDRRGYPARQQMCRVYRKVHSQQLCHEESAGTSAPRVQGALPTADRIEQGLEESAWECVKRFT